MTERHVLGLSGGRDSAALAVFMRQSRPEIDVAYFFTDTGKELPEVYEFLGRLEGFLGKPIRRLNPERDFDFWLREYGHFLPSPKTRWCTRQLKLRPFEQWIKRDLDAGHRVISYVAIRADESQRGGHVATHPNLSVRFPFREQGVDKAGVFELLDLPVSACRLTIGGDPAADARFAFFQQKIEWARLKREHPEHSRKRSVTRRAALEHGSPFTWSQGESLAELESRSGSLRSE